MDRLSLATLDRLPAAVQRPAYDIAATRVGIVHLGVGAFFRAHQAAYLDDVLASDPQWAVAGASLRRGDMRDALAPQDGLYTLAVRSGEGTRLRVLGSLRSIDVVPEDPEALIRTMIDPAVRIVSLTVTEKGYCHDPATGDLNEHHPDIEADLKTPTRPGSTPGLLAEALYRRRQTGLAPFTIMPCDNLPANGPTVHRILSQYARLRDPAFGRFVETEVAVAGTMVDRIVPATKGEDIAAICAELGLQDAWPVTAEPFTQWVIEDRFSAGRPDFSAVGAEMVSDVEPFERMKLRMLNGSHSVLAYLGYLAGHETVSDAIADPDFERLVRGMMAAEIMPTLGLGEPELRAYSAALIQRFQNPALQHRTWQIAMDGSQKLPQRLLDTVRVRLAQDAPFDRIALGIAAWMRYVSGEDERGQAIDVRDPMAARLKGIATAGGRDVAALVQGYLAVEEIFGRDLRQDRRFTEAVETALALLFDRGSAAAVAAYAQR